MPRADDEGRASRRRDRRHHDRGYCSHWVCQISFDEPIVLASCSPKHDTHPLIVADAPIRGVDSRCRSGRHRSVLLVPGPQVSLHGARVPRHGRWVAGRARCHRLARMRGVRSDARHVRSRSVFRRVSSPWAKGGSKRRRCCTRRASGWRAAGDAARQPGDSVRDRLLARLAELGVDAGDEDDDD